MSGKSSGDTERSDDLLDWAGVAVRGILCEVSGCTAHPGAERNGRNLCAKHRDHYDHATMGEQCDRCGSKQWVETPDAASVAVCAICDFVTYEEGELAPVDEDQEEDR